MASDGPPQPQTQEFEEKSSLGADRGIDKTKMQNAGVPVDSAVTGIPIAMMGKKKEVGDHVAAFLRPTYMTVHFASNLEDMLSALPDLEIQPVGVILGGGFSPQEQEEAEKKIHELKLSYGPVKVVKSNPLPSDLQGKYSSLPLPDVAAHAVKEVLDRAGLVDLPSTAEAVTKNAV